MKKSFKNILGIVLAFALICGAVFSNKINVYATTNYGDCVTLTGDYFDGVYILYIDRFITNDLPYYSISYEYDRYGNPVFNIIFSNVKLYAFERSWYKEYKSLGSDLLSNMIYARYTVYFSSFSEGGVFYLDKYEDYHISCFHSHFNSCNFLLENNYDDMFQASAGYRIKHVYSNYTMPYCVTNDDGAYIKGVGNFFEYSETDSGSGSGSSSSGSGSVDIDMPVENPEDTVEGNIFTWIKSILINIVNLPIKISVALQGFFDDLPSNIAIAFSSILTKITAKVEALKLGIDDLPNLIATSLSSFFTNIVIKVQEVKDKVGDIFDNIKSLPENLFTKFTRLFIPDEDFMHSKIFQLTDHLTKFGIKTYDITSLFAKEQAITSFNGTYRGKEVTFIDMRYLDLFLNKFRPVIRGFIVLCLMLFNVNQFLNLIGQGSISVSGVLNAVKERDKGEKE